MRVLISIDPGINGAIAVRDADGRVFAEDMPETVADIAEHLASLAFTSERVGGGQLLMRQQRPDPTQCFIEDVGFHVQGNNASASCKFAMHVGTLHGILACWKIPYQAVRPQAWMKHYGTLPKDKKDRKNKLKEYAQRAFPHIKVTLKNADALCMLKALTKED